MMAQSQKGTLVYRHRGLVRITHWLNVIFFAFLLVSGLQIFNAHPALYWGQKAAFANPWMSMTSDGDENGNAKGITTIAGHPFTTTGVLGLSSNGSGELEERGFPAWSTLPATLDLATGRRWHFFFAWFFVINGAIYLLYAVLSRHAWRDLVPSAAQMRGVGRSVVDHLRLRFSHGADYNVLQKLTYLPVVFILLPLMVLTGLTMSPGFDAVLPWLLDVFGGRQSARSIHFISATLLVLFVIVHVVMVLVSGVWNNMRSMITGRYKIEGGAETL